MELPMGSITIKEWRIIPIKQINGTVSLLLFFLGPLKVLTPTPTQRKNQIKEGSLLMRNQKDMFQKKIQEKRLYIMK